MKQIVAGAVCVIGLSSLLSCVSFSDSTKKPDAVSGATSVYAAGDRGALPPEGEGYTVLGVRDGIKSWAVKYDEGLIRGGEFYDDRAAESLKDWGVKTVISIKPTEKERDLCRQQGFVLVEIPFDKKQGLTDADIRKFLDTIKTQPSMFYVHCVGGAHRGGVLGVAYRVHVLGGSYEQALAEFERLGGDLNADRAMLEAVRNFKR